MRFKQGQADRLKEEVESMKGRGSGALAAACAQWASMSGSAQDSHAVHAIAYASKCVAGPLE